MNRQLLEAAEKGNADSQLNLGVKMLTATQQHAVDQFAKSLLALEDDALIDTHHQAWEDHREARTEGSDNLSKAYAKSLATENAMRDRFPDYRSRYKLRYP